MQSVYVLLRRLGTHRGAPRLYLDTPALERAGLRPGMAVSVELRADQFRLTLRVDPAGQRRVSSKQRCGRAIPVLDINNSEDLDPFVTSGVVRILITQHAVHVLLPASIVKALARLDRVSSKLALDQPLMTASLAFGAGISCHSLHEGLASAGVSCELVMANEICESYASLASANNPTVAQNTTMAVIPMQETAQDDWLLDRIGTVDVLEAGIPCSGASKAGKSKRKLARMEDHPLVGHLIGAVIQLIGRLQPAVVVIENVESYRDTASAAILRGWLGNAGYAVTETVLDASDFGSLEARVRWFLVASPPQLALDLTQLSSPGATTQKLVEVLDPIDPDDARYRTVEYLKAKAISDEETGRRFRALAGQRRIGARNAFDLADGLVQAFDGLACAAPSKRIASKTGPEGPGMRSRGHQPLARRSSGVLPAASAALNQSGRLPKPPQVWP